MALLELTQFQLFDLLHDVQQQAAHLPWLPDVIVACGEPIHITESMVHYVDAIQANQPGASWQFTHNVIVRNEQWGEVVLDILEGPRIGAVEFLNRISTAY